MSRTPSHPPGGAGKASANLTLAVGDRQFTVDTHAGYDLSIPLQFDAEQPRAFGAASATGTVLTAGGFTGDVRRGGSCNCSTYSLTPHCNGTHTECVGHLTVDRVQVRDIAGEALVPAQLLSVALEDAAQTPERSLPAPHSGDRLITRSGLQRAAGVHDMRGCRALIVRTLPNGPEKRFRDYGAAPAAYFSSDAMQWIVSQEIDHLVVDLPSVDRAADAGLLTAHRLFWGMPPGATQALHAARGHATITELAYIDDAIPDGMYLLNLQVAPFASDAAPSRPVLLKLIAS